MTKTLAKRLERVVSHLVHPNQSGFIKGRFIGEGIRFVEDIIEYMDYNKEPGLSLQLDFEKAVDSVEWPFLLHVLKQFGFGDNFIEWVKYVIHIYLHQWETLDFILYGLKLREE